MKDSSIKLFSDLKNKVNRKDREIIVDILNRYLSFKSKVFKANTLHLNNLIVKKRIYTSLIKNYKPKIDQYLRIETPEYNIFKIIGLHKKEVTTHTPFLANLLDKHASHQHSTCFLNLFLKDVICFPDDDIGNINDWQVFKELGYIDLRIVNEKDKKAIFIENKIGIQAHSGQLSAYFTKWKDEYPNGGAFLFLNIHGDPPSEEGFDESICPKDVVLSELRVISYKVDIKKWLDDCTHSIEIESKKLLYTIKQYIELIDKL